MHNFLFEDNNTGERFFVQCDSYAEALQILLNNGFWLHDCQYIGVFTDEEAEWAGYDTY